MLKNVIIVTDTAYVDGGAAKIAIDTALSLHRAGVNVHYFAGTGPVAHELEQAHIPVEAIGLHDILYDRNRVRAVVNGLWSFKAENRLRKFLRNFSPQDTVVQIHVWSKFLSPSIFRSVEHSDFECFIVLHDYFYACPNGGLYDFQSKHICQLHPMSPACLLRNCDARSYTHKLFRVARQFLQDRWLMRLRPRFTFIAISELTLRLARQHLPQGTNLVKILNPIDFHPVDTARSLIPQHYTFVGRVSKEKGADLFCEAISRTRVKGCVIGKGPMLEDLRRKYPDIRFTGWLDPKEKDQHYRRSKALVMGATWMETFGLVVAEIKSLGIPALVPDKVGASEIIEDGKTGLLYESGNLSSLCQAIQRVEAGELSGCAEAVRSSMSHLHTHQSYARVLIQLFEDRLTHPHSSLNS